MVGPFTQYIQPGVYTRTLTNATIASLTGGLRIPLFIGVGSETLNLSNYELVRGSSSVIDNVITNEDVSAQFDGTNRTFTVAHFPITNGNGQGVSSFNPQDVKVTINGNPAGVAQVFGDLGKVVLTNIPAVTDKVLITYYFKRTDTKIENEDDSIQADGSKVVFKTQFVPIVDGTHGGRATTDTSKVSVKVNGINVKVKSVDGQTGHITLDAAPQLGDSVKISYWTNTWQYTFDYLPVSGIRNVVAVGDAPGRSDYTNTVDFIVQEDKIHWGSSFSVKASAQNTAPASTPFQDQINSFLVDNKALMLKAAGVCNGLNTTFTLEYIPTDGTGKNYTTDQVGLLTAYVGTSVTDARSRPPVAIDTVSGDSRTVVLDLPPAVGQNVYVSYYYNLISDDSFSFESVVPSTPSSLGTYTITSFNSGVCMNIQENRSAHSVADPNFAIEGITYPAGGFDGQTVPGYSVAETILLNFFSATEYLVLSSIGAQGSNGSGSLGQTYIDEKTGVRLTVMPGTIVNYSPGDILEFTVQPNFETSALPHHAVLGIKTIVTNTNGVEYGNVGVLSTFRKSGYEPDVGSFYYISLDYEKTKFPIAVYTKLNDVVSAVGPVNTDNRLSLAAYLAFSNGAIAVALAQVLRDPSGIDANEAAYYEVLSQIESPIPNTNIKPSIICPVTTKKDVINAVRIHCEKMSTIRYASERTGMFGFAVGTTPEAAQAFARNQMSSRLVGVYPDGAVIGLVDEFGNVTESAIDGSFLAAALAGLAVNPIYDVATPLTHKKLTGFVRLITPLDAITMNQTAVAGITILEDLSPSFLIRQAMTTDPTNVLTREPTVVFIQDYVQQQIRGALDPFIGLKFLPNVIQDVEVSVDGLLNQLVNQQIITAFTGTSAKQDPVDPTILNVETYYSPVFPLNWIVVTLNLRVSL